MKKLLLLIGLLLALFILTNSFNKSLPLKNPADTSEKVRVVTEESVTVDIVKKAGVSVVTIAEEPTRDARSRTFNFGPFSIFGLPAQQEEDVPTEPESIGSGFIIAKEGLVITNKHVVSNPQSRYQIVTSNDKKFTVENVYRDPLNDIAILKVNPGQNAGNNLVPVELGDSSKLQAGQYVVAIGTALGEFKNTVTTGVISGLGRGITAGNPFEGYVERLDNVIQTDAAISPGNSGGPLLNSSGQVIGVNTAVSSAGQNIGFAIPINVIKDSVKNFNETGRFERPYLGVSYRLISRDVALLNDVPEGAYVQQVIEGSSADNAGVEAGDIIVKLDGQRVNENMQVSNFIARKKVGDTIVITLFRDGDTREVRATLQIAPQQ
jgi:serine protease Do